MRALSDVRGAIASRVTIVPKELHSSLARASARRGATDPPPEGGAGRAVGVSIKEVVECIALNRESVLPVSAHQNGKLGIRDISLSLPTKVGRRGAHEILEPAVSDAEKEGLLKSAQSLKDVWGQIQ